jgi:hypothetical protein
LNIINSFANREDLSERIGLDFGTRPFFPVGESSMKSLNFSLALVLFSCFRAFFFGNQNGSSNVPTAIDFREQDPVLTPYGAVSAGDRWDRNSITVCWLDHPEFASQRTWVEKAVRSTWMKVSSVRFTGVSSDVWSDCTQQGADIRIQVSDNPLGPRSLIGKSSVGRSPSMWLNFTFASWGQSCQSKTESCIESIAIHEFGHAAGFEHEQLRSDAPKACVDYLKKTGTWEVVDRKPTPLTPYDPDSVMNYCNSIWLNSGKLSANDEKAILILFPLA